MEVLVILAVIYCVIKVLSKTGQKVIEQPQSQGAKQAQATAPAQQHQMHAEPRKKPHAQQTSNLNTSNYAFTPRTEYRHITHRMEGIASRHDYQGSLGGSSTEGVGANSAEGIDLCDSSLGHNRTSVLSEKPLSQKKSAGTLKLDTSTQGLLQGIVMSEILARPTHRKWGNH